MRDMFNVWIVISITTTSFLYGLSNLQDITLGSVVFIVVVDIVVFITNRHKC